MKVKDNDELINVIRLNEDQLISVLTHKGMSLTYSSEELSDTGLRAAGVKSINLKDEDFVVMTDVVDSDSSIIMATQRGAVKRISYKILQQAKRALQRELKKNPHRVVAGYVVKDESMYTLYSESHSEEGQITDIHLSEQYTNGSFVVDVKEFGDVLDMTID